MKIVGALKIPEKKSDFFFCEYENATVKWTDLIKFFLDCNVQYDIDEENILFIVLESADNLCHDRRINSVVCNNDNGVQIITNSSQIALTDYIQELID